MKKRVKLYIALFLFTSLTQACSILCSPAPPAPRPPLPTESAGWGEQVSSNNKNYGKLLLRKGEESSNETFGVKLINIHPPKECTSPNEYFGQVRADFQVFYVANPNQKCNVDGLITGLFQSTSCSFPFEACEIHIISTNIHDGWVLFEFWKK